MKKSVSGIRGEIGDGFGPREVMAYCAGFAGLLAGRRGGQQCVVAADTRPGGEALKAAAAAALAAGGVDVLDLGIAPTPAAFYEARRIRSGAGVVVTASHNPIGWNGLKFILDGRGIGEAETAAVVAAAEAGGHGAGGGVVEGIGTDYVEAALVVAAARGVRDPPGVVVDAGGGAARDAAPRLLRGMGCRVSVINAELSSSGRGPDPTAEGLEGLAAACAGASADAGFAFDMDGDRLVVVAGGRKQAPDATLGLGVAAALRMGHRRFVLSADTSSAVERLAEDGGGRVQRSKVGEANVVAAMLEARAQAGGEGSSAGFILPGFNYCRDGILTAGLVAAMLCGGGEAARDALEAMRGSHMVREKAPADSALHGRTLEGVERMMGRRFSEVDTLDGVKGIADEGSWVMVRGSNTEDAVRISAEGADPRRAGELAGEARRMVAESYEAARRA